MINHTSKPELLLPAGDFTAVVAAVQNGADAVYLGGRSFSARQNAHNFDSEELRQALQYCHTRGVRVYQTLNTLVFDSQFSAALEAVKIGCALGVDAFIVQDWGILRLLREHCPTMRIHASTQMAVHSPRGLRLLEEAGVKRAVLARELSLEEIRDIVRSTNMEIEVFVHGALCMSLSGQCYMSGMLGGRSGNRGACAGTCRLPWTVGGGLPDPSRDYGLSLKDLCLAEQLSALAELGVASLKVEGRMKRPEYVAAAAKTYRAALDEGVVTAEGLDTLRAVFSRSGFTDGYLTGKRDDMFGYRQKEDVVSATPKILKAIENSWKGEHGRVPLSLELTARAGEPVSLTAYDRDGHTAKATGAIPEPAANKPTTEEGLCGLLQKLGGTIFCPEESGLRVALDDGLFLSASAVNELRREVCAQIREQREVLCPIPFCEVCSADAVLDGAADRSTAEVGNLSGRTHAQTAVSVGQGGQHSSGHWRASFARFDQIPFEWISPPAGLNMQGVSGGGNGKLIERFSLPPEEALAHAEALLPYGSRFFVEPERAMFSREEEIFGQLEVLHTRGFQGLLCNNIAHLEMARALSMEAHGGAMLNAVNSRSVCTLADWGVIDQILSFELKLSDAVRIEAPVPLGVICYGFLPLMLVRNCPVKNRIPCRDCGGKGSLTDRTGARFSVRCGQKRYAEILNGNVLWLADRAPEFRSFGFQSFLFTGESREECRRVLEGYRTGASASDKFTRGLYYRSI